MIYSKMTVKALNTAYNAHMGQTDRCGLPYIFHPYHVAEQMTTEETVTAALLHDIIEDTTMTMEDLRELGFPEIVLEAVKLLTHDKSEDYFNYVRALKDNAIARTVKFADLAHNSDLTRLESVTENDLKRLEKYKKARDILLEE